MSKRVKVAVGIVVALLVLAGTGVATVVGVSKSKLAATFPVPKTEVTVPTDDASVKEGRRLLDARGCSACHGLDLGGYMEDVQPVMSLYGPNLTAGEGSAIAAFSDADIANIVRHGVRPNGDAVIFMPAHEYWEMSDREIGLIIAGLRKLTPVDRPRQPTVIGPIGHMLNATDQMVFVPAGKIDHDAPRPALEPPPSLEFGSYLAKGCMGCHGDTFAGGPIPGAPSSLPVPLNLTFHETGLAHYDLAKFMKTLRTGIRATGEPLDPFMPVRAYKAMTDDELTSIWNFLQTQPKKPFGER